MPPLESSSSSTSSNSPLPVRQGTTSADSSPRTQQESPSCHTCRKRRVRCDGERPACRKCMTKGVSCAGYSKQRPLVWLEGGGRQNEDIRAGANNAPKKRGRPKMIVAKHEAGEVHRIGEEVGNTKTTNIKAEEEEEDVNRGIAAMGMGLLVPVKGAAGAITLNLDNGVSLPRSLTIPSMANVKRAVETVRYYDDFIFPGVTPILYHPTKHYTDPSVFSQNMSIVLWDVICWVVAVHQTVSCQRAGLLEDHSGKRGLSRLELSRDVYQSRTRAFRLLNEELRNPEKQLHDLTLICVLTMLLAETQISARGDWWSHFEGAYRIIELRGGLGYLFRERPYMKCNLTYFMAADVLSATTTGGISVAHAERQLEYRHIINELFQDGYETAIPCPNELFDALIRINYLRTTCRSTEPFAFHAAVTDLLQDIASFSTSKWATKMAHHYETNADYLPVSTEKLGYIRPTWDTWQRIGGTYHAAVLLYCIRSLALGYDQMLCIPIPEPTVAVNLTTAFQPDSSDSSSSFTYVTVRDIQLVAKHTLAEHIGALFAPCADPGASPSRSSVECPPEAKIAVWPIFVAGVEAAVDPGPYISSKSASGFAATEKTSPNEALDLVLTHLRTIGRSLGTLNLQEACEMLRTEWERNCARWDRHAHWEWQAEDDTRWWGEVFEGVTERCCFFM